MEKCKYCDNSIEEAALFCPYCGNSLNKVDTAKQSQKDDVTAALEEPCAMAEDVSVPTTKNWFLDNKKYSLLALGIAVLIFLSIMCIPLIMGEVKLKNAVADKDYKALEHMILISNNRNAIEALIAMKDDNSAIYAENLLLSKELNVDMKKTVWKNLIKYKVLLPSGMVSLYSKQYDSLGDHDIIKQYCSAIMSADVENTAIRTTILEFANNRDIDALDTFMRKVKFIIDMLPEENKTVYSKITNLIEDWKKLNHEKEEAENKMNTLRTKIDNPNRDNQRIIDKNLTEMHSLVMAVYAGQNFPIFAPKNIQEMFNANFEQTDRIVKGMAEDFSRGDPVEKTRFYFDIAWKLGDKELIYEVGKLGKEITSVTNELKTLGKEYVRIEKTYNESYWNWQGQIKSFFDKIDILLTGNLDFAKNPQYGQLNKIKLMPGVNDATFKTDILGNGIEQTFTIIRDKSAYMVNISQQNKILKTFNIRGSSLASDGMGTGQWYTAYLRNNNIPDIIYFFVDGSRAFVNDFKIIGKMGNNEIGILFDESPHNFAERIGSQNQLSINGTQLIVTGKSGQIILNWNGNNFTVQ